MNTTTDNRRTAAGGRGAQSAPGAEGVLLAAALILAYATLRVWYSLVINAQAIVGPELGAEWAADTVATTSMLTRLGLDALVFLVADRLKTVVGRPFAVWGCALALVLSAVFVGAATHGWFGGAVLLVAGGVLCGVSWELMALMWTEAFTAYTDRTVERFVLVKIALDAVLFPLCLLPFEPIFILCLLLPVACALGLLGSGRLPQRWRSRPARHWNRVSARTALPLFGGIALLFVGFNLATTGAIAPIVQERIAGMPANTFIMFAGRWATLALMLVAARFARDSHFEVYFCGSALVTIAGLLVLPLSDTIGHPVYHIAMIVAAFMAENGIILATVSVARSSAQSPLRVLAAGRVCLRVGAATGILLSQVTAGLFAGDAGEEARAYMSALLVMLVAIVAMWLLREQNFSALLWGNGQAIGTDGRQVAAERPASKGSGALPGSRGDGTEAGNGAHETAADSDALPSRSPTAAKCRRFAQEFGLTPRETEVLELLLDGRSIPYIKETLHVSGDTVKTHVRHIYQKMDIHNRQDLISFAQER